MCYYIVTKGDNMKIINNKDCYVQREDLEYIIDNFVDYYGYINN